MVLGNVSLYYVLLASGWWPCGGTAVAGGVARGEGRGEGSGGYGHCSQH